MIQGEFGPSIVGLSPQESFSGGVEKNTYSIGVLWKRVGLSFAETWRSFTIWAEKKWIFSEFLHNSLTQRGCKLEDGIFLKNPSSNCQFYKGFLSM